MRNYQRAMWIGGASAGMESVGGTLPVDHKVAMELLDAGFLHRRMAYPMGYCAYWYTVSQDGLEMLRDAENQKELVE